MEFRNAPHESHPNRQQTADLPRRRVARGWEGLSRQVVLSAIAACSIVLAAWPTAEAQSLGVLRPDDETHAFLERQRTLGRLPEAFLAARPLSAAEANTYLDSLAARGGLGRTDSVRLARLRGTSVPAPTQLVRRVFGRAAYADGRNFYSVRDTSAGYALAVNPLADTRIGVGRQTRADDRRSGGLVYTNNRGIRTTGQLGRLFFESRVEEILEKPLLRRDTLGTLPRERNIDVLDRNDPLNEVSYDYGRVAGIVGYDGKFVEARFGRDRFRLGEAEGSLWLSNYASVYDHLQLRTTVWRIQYTNVFAAMETFPSPGPSRALERKYGAFHQIDVSLPGRVGLQLYEGVVHLPDPESGRGRYDLSFLNPIIFYRHVEDSFNTLGNKQLGLGASWIATPGAKVYGQALLTEFRARELFSSAGWWANKWAALGGVTLSDPLGATGLDVTAEFAAVRPYTYSHRGNSNATHHRDVLGYPAGQNLYDIALRTRYQPTASLSARADIWYTQRGRDTDSTVVGGNPLTNYLERSEDYDVRFLDGVRVNELGIEGEIAMEVLPTLYAGASVRAAMNDDAASGLYRGLAIQASLRWGLPFSSSRY